ncbi:MAG: Rieske 2Fe-2S domain-containing protein [Gemmatimonadaceae bacterium]|nr:Rieske 2Fe-2S domain-containing protein [Gemmatimonadaceae bacterium]
MLPDPVARGTVTRRELLEAGWKIGGGLLAVAAAWTSWEALRPLADVSGGGVLALKPASSYTEGTATFVREGRLYVTRAGGALHALAQKCPHLGCAVPFCAASGRFECPCHGSHYDLAGEWLAGPAPRGMDRHPLQVIDGRVHVNTTVLELGPPLGTDRVRLPTREGGCAPPAP